MPENPLPLRPPVPSTGVDAPKAAKPKKRRARRRWWFLLFLATVASLALSPAPWHAVLRSFLTLRAARQGWDLHIGAIEGGLFDATELYDVHCVQHAEEHPAQPLPAPGTDFQIDRAELVFAWRWPWLQAPAPSWIDRIALEGLHGTCDFSRLPAPASAPLIWQMLTGGGWSRVIRASAHRLVDRIRQALGREIEQLDHKWLPANLFINGDALTLRCGRYRLHADGWRLAAMQDELGRLAARRVEVSGPKSDSTLPMITGWTYWKGSSLAFGDIDLGRGVRLANATLNGEHLAHRRLDWDGELRALGGSARGQGSVNFSRPRLAVEIAGSLEKMAVGPLAKLLGVRSETDGEVQQANFTFRGDPENWPAAEMWLAAQATDFRWGQRRWESLELQGTIIHRRVQVHRLELHQSRNQLSFTGDCALPVDAASALEAPGPDANWWQAGFSCNIDARLDDLHAFAQLAGDQLPEIGGRMSVNGTLTARAGTPGIDGYLNVEGSALSIRGAPLDSLRTTLLFRGADLNIPDVEATRGDDYFRGNGTVRIIGPARYKAELHAAIKDLMVYAPAYADLAFSPQPVSGSLTLDWSGDGAPGANSGAFQGTTEHFFTKGGPAALARPIDLAADGTYSPESVSFRHLVLKEGAGEKQREALKLAGALPWTRDPQAFAAGRWLDPDRGMAVRVVADHAPLDLLAGLAPRWLASADGQISGWLNADGTLRTPKLEADLQVRNATFHSARGFPDAEEVDAKLRVENSVLHIEQAKGRWGTQALDLTGDMNLADTKQIGLDLTLHGVDTAGIHDQAVNADLSYAVTLRDSAPAGIKMAGEIHLSNGEYEQPLFVGFDNILADGWQRPLQDLPFVGPGTQIDLHLSATPPLQVAGTGADAGLSPDLEFSGTMQSPRTAGELIFRHAALHGPGGWEGVGDGGWYFSRDQPGDPTVSISAQGANGAQVFFYGATAACQMVSWSDEPPEDRPLAAEDFGLLPANSTPAWSELNAMATFARNVTF